MSPREANVLLTKIALVDRWFKRDEDAAAQAEAWSEILADVSVDAALDAVREHYAVETRSIMPADIRAAAPAWLGSSDAGNVTEIRLACERRAVTS